MLAQNARVLQETITQLAQDVCVVQERNTMAQHVSVLLGWDTTLGHVLLVYLVNTKIAAATFLALAVRQAHILGELVTMKIGVKRADRIHTPMRWGLPDENFALVTVDILGMTGMIVQRVRLVNINLAVATFPVLSVHLAQVLRQSVPRQRRVRRAQ